MAPMRSFGLVSALMFARLVAVGGEPLGGQAAGVARELLELGRVEDGLLDLADVEGQIAVAGTVRLEQLAAELREGVPVGARAASRSRSGMPPCRWALRSWRSSGSDESM